MRLGDSPSQNNRHGHRNSRQRLGERDASRHQKEQTNPARTRGLLHSLPESDGLEESAGDQRHGEAARVEAEAEAARTRGGPDARTETGGAQVAAARESARRRGSDGVSHENRQRVAAGREVRQLLQLQ